jgi:hypothetical protein
MRDTTIIDRLIHHAVITELNIFSFCAEETQRSQKPRSDSDDSKPHSKD